MSAPAASKPKPPATLRSSPAPRPVARQPVAPSYSESSSPVEMDSEAIPYAPYESMGTPRKMNPWWIFLGADVGMSTFSTFNDSTTEAGRSGLHLGVRGLLAHYWNKWVIDGGLGWHFFQNSATYPSGDKIKVTTRGGYIDFSPRYRFPRSNWQLGLEAEFWISGDNGSNSNVFDDTSNHPMFIGIQGVYEWPSDDNLLRFGGRLLTDLNVSGRTANIYQVFFQFGFSVFGGSVKREPPSRKYERLNESDLEKASAYTPPVDPLPIATPEPEATPWKEPIAIATPEPTPVPTATPKPIAKEKLVITLDVNDLPFDFDSARMPRYNMDRVREIGRFLGEHKSAWKSITVSGHTDERGSNEYNNKLSKARADTVRQLLGEGGAPTARIKAVGMGERKPKVKGHNEKAWAKNRRVELEFHGVKDMQVINKAFDTGKSETR